MERRQDGGLTGLWLGIQPISAACTETRARATSRDHRKMYVQSRAAAGWPATHPARCEAGQWHGSGAAGWSGRAGRPGHQRACDQPVWCTCERLGGPSSGVRGGSGLGGDQIARVELGSLYRPRLQVGREVSEDGRVLPSLRMSASSAQRTTCTGRQMTAGWGEEAGGGGRKADDGRLRRVSFAPKKPPGKSESALLHCIAAHSAWLGTQRNCMASVDAAATGGAGLYSLSSARAAPVLGRL